MSILTDYLSEATVERLQKAFSTVADNPLCVCLPDGTPVLAPGRQTGESAEKTVDVPITLTGLVIGHVCIHAGAASDVDRRVAQLMADVVSHLCQREKQLRSRAEQLATLYKLTAEFTSHRDLEGVLDVVTATVVDTLKAKACAIRLLNSDRTELVMAAVCNLSETYLNKGPILVSASQIDREVLQGKAVYIGDMQTDSRVLYPAEARAEGLVSGLCVAMMYRGRPEGILRVYMDHEHEFDWFEVSLIQAIAANAATAIVNARLHSDVVRAAEMRRQLRLAGEVQRRMTARIPSDAEGLDIGAVYVPCYELAGDFYDFIRLPEDNLGVVVCDVIGKGVRASLMTAAIRASLRANAANIYEMSEVLDRINSELCADTHSSDFATMCYAVIDTRSRRLTCANAGHPPPLLFSRGKDVRELTVGGGIIGLDADMDYTHENLALHAGDVLVMYTDGLSEAMNFENETFGAYRIQAAAQAAIDQKLSADAAAKHILWEMRRFAGLQTRFDDLTLVVIKVL